MKTHRFLASMLVVFTFGCSFNAQSQSRKGTKKNFTAPSVVIQNDVLGHGFDVRNVDPLSWGTSSKGKNLINGAPSSSAIQQTFPEEYHFVTSPYEFEKLMLQSDSIHRPYRAFSSNSYFKPLNTSDNDKLLFVYSKKKKAVQRASLYNASQKTLDSAMVSDFKRLGRDITPEGFIHRYGTHYAAEVVYGGIFMRRNLYAADDYIYSPYNEQEFKSKVIEDLNSFYTRQNDADPFINTKIGDDYTVGGNTNADWHTQWENSVSSRAHPIEVALKPYPELFRKVAMPDIEDKGAKIQMLDSIIQQVTNQLKDSLYPETKSKFYKKYSLRFKQKLTRIVKTSMGRDTDDPNDYTGDIFFGGFSKDDAILKQSPLMEYGGIRLETLITDEELKIDRNVIITIKPEDLKRGYVSVWDDTKKLFKGGGRTTLRVSGTKEAKTVYKDALLQIVEKTIEIETIDKDVYDVTYTVELIKDKGFIENTTTTYNYVMDTELVAAATIGDKERLSDFFKRNGNRNSSGIIKAIIVNKQADDVLNLVLDHGVIPTTEDLDLLFDPEYFDREKALILLERGAVPKNNMIYKAVAFESADVIYALFREGATPRNNDLAFALDKYHYPCVKALMSEEYEEFVAGKNELLLAAENNDEDLAQKFVALGATADAYILDTASAFENQALENVIVPVTDANGETLEVVAKMDDTKLFDYFVKKNAKIDTNKAAEIATDNSNTEILDLALKNGGEATEALEYAIEKENKPAVEVSLQNRANPEAVFAYAAKIDDSALFQDALMKYGGSPAIALQEAVKEDRVNLAQAVITLKRADVNPTKAMEIAVSNQSLPMVELLVTNDADPNEGISEAIEREDVPITAYLIKSGAKTVDPGYIQKAVKKENLELSKLLIEEGSADVNDAIVEASETANVEITEYLLDKGASPTAALVESMETKNEDIILLLLEKSPGIDPEFISTASRKGNLKVVKKLIEKGLLAENGIEDAMRYKHADVVNYLITKGAQPSSKLLQTALKYNFTEGIDIMLENDVDVSAPFKDGQYAIHMVCTSYEEGDLVLIDKLLRANVNINARNKAGETALHLVVNGGEKNYPIIDKLISEGVQVYAKASNGMTALDYSDDRTMKSYLKKAEKKQRKKK